MSDSQAQLGRAATRRQFLRISGVATAAAAAGAAGLPLFHFRRSARAAPPGAGASGKAAKLESWEELHRHFPDSKVILSVRDSDRWYESVRETIYPASTEIPGWLRLLVPRLGKFAELARRGIWDGTFDGRFEDRAHAPRLFGRHEVEGPPPDHVLGRIPQDALEISIYRGDHTVWCNKCQQIVMIRDCPHSQEDYLMLSGTKVREMLSKGESLPTEFARTEVAKILMNYYQNL